MRKFAVSGLDVLGQHFQAPRQVLAALGERRAQKLGIGGQEVRRRQRRGDLAQIELRLLALVRIEIVGAPDQIVRPARRQHIGLLDEVEIRIVAPCGVGEALVGGVGRGDRRRLFALQALQCRGPELDELPGQRRLRLKGPLRLGQVIFGHPAERPDHFAHLVGGRGLDLPAFPRTQVSGERLAAMLDRECDIVGERFHVGDGRLSGGAFGRRGSGPGFACAWRRGRRNRPRWARGRGGGLGRSRRGLGFAGASPLGPPGARLRLVLRKSVRKGFLRRGLPCGRPLASSGGGVRFGRSAKALVLRSRLGAFGGAFARCLDRLRLPRRRLFARTGLGHDKVSC